MPTALYVCSCSTSYFAGECVIVRALGCYITVWYAVAQALIWPEKEYDYQMLVNSNTCLLSVFGCRILSYLDMKQIGRHYYNSKIPIHITQHRYTHTASCWYRHRYTHTASCWDRHRYTHTASCWGKHRYTHTASCWGKHRYTHTASCWGKLR